MEPAATFDIDIFVSFGDHLEGALVSLEPIYTYLGRHGYKSEREHLVIEGWPVQFLAADDRLYREALHEAIEVPYEDIKIRVMTAEHLMVIALRTGRGKDLIRIEQFVELGAFDPHRLESILGGHQLLDEWKEFGGKYLKGPNE